jgi:hypothetical protein
MDPRPRKQTGVPRRFGVGVMMVITTMYAVLFAVLQSTPVGVFVSVALFFTIIGVSQAVLFKGRNPRLASILTGMVLGLLLALIIAVVEIRSVPLEVIVIIPFVYGGLGALAGYVVGWLIAAVFLFFNKWQPPLDAEEPATGEKSNDIMQWLQSGEGKSPFAEERPDNPDNPAGGGKTEQ